jgi:hypothetical protein
LSNDPQTIVARGSSTSDAWHLDLLKGKPQFWSWSHSGAQVLEAPTAIALDQWTHLAMSFDGASKRLYVNGEQVGLQDGVSGLIYDVTAPLTIGSGWIGARVALTLMDEWMKLAFTVALSGLPRSSGSRTQGASEEAR